jgi:hypothetical protein
MRPASTASAQHEGEVIDPGGLGLDLLPRHVHVLREGANRPVDRVAQANGRDRAGLGHSADQHRHGVRVVEEHGVGAHVLDVPDDAEDHRDGAQATQDAADIDGVVDRVLQAVAGRDVEVEVGRPGASHLDGVHHEIRAGQGGAAVEVAADRRAGAERLRAPAGHAHRGLEPFAVDVVEDQLGVAQLGVREEVPEQVAGELDAPRADQDDAGHAGSSTPTMCRRPWL